MRSMRVVLAAATALVLTGCINSSTLITVKPDGSGTVEQTTLMNVGALKAMMPGAADQAPNPVNEDNLKRTAEKMGKGVRLVSAEPMKANGFEGVKALFAFDDINQVQVSQDPDMGGGPDGAAAPEPKADEPVRFSLTRQGGASTLTIVFQDKPSGGATAAEPTNGMPDLSDPMMMGMLKAMFQGFKINIDLAVAGDIVKTNAEYVTGSRITLLEMDMNALMADEAKFKALQGKLGPSASLSEVKPYLKDIKGIKVDGPTISVTFK